MAPVGRPRIDLKIRELILFWRKPENAKCPLLLGLIPTKNKTRYPQSTFLFVEGDISAHRAKFSNAPVYTHEVGEIGERAVKQTYNQV